MNEMDVNKLINICVNTFAKYHGLLTNQVNVIKTYEKSIWINETQLKDDQVSTQPLSKCVFIETTSNMGRYDIYMRKSGLGKVYWLKK